MYQRSIAIRIFSIVGLVVGVFLLVIGILAASGEFSSYYYRSSSSGSGIIRSVFDDLFSLLGLGMIAAGGLVIAVFGTKLVCSFPSRPKISGYYPPVSHDVRQYPSQPPSFAPSARPAYPQQPYQGQPYQEQQPYQNQQAAQQQSPHPSNAPTNNDKFW